MIRKPADSQPLDERAAVRMVRTAAAFATQARRGGVAAAGLFVYAIAIFLGIMAIANGLARLIRQRAPERLASVV